MRRLSVIAITALCSASIAGGLAVGVLKHREAIVVTAAVAEATKKAEPGFYVTNADAKKCVDDECALVTKADTLHALSEIYEKGKKAGAAEQKDACWANTSWGLR